MQSKHRNSGGVHRSPDPNGAGSPDRDKPSSQIHPDHPAYWCSGEEPPQPPLPPVDDHGAEPQWMPADDPSP